MDLKLRIRRGSSRDKSTTCFARLHPNTAKALIALQVDKIAGIHDNLNSWTYDPFKTIDFLPLKLTTSSPDTDPNVPTKTTCSTYFISYNGGPCEEENVIEIPDFMTPNKYMITDGIIRVEPLFEIQNAGLIEIKPLKSDYWELIEIFAEKLENDILLSQISVVYPDQIITLVLGNDTVKVQVLPSRFISMSHLNASLQESEGDTDNLPKVMQKQTFCKESSLDICDSDSFSIESDESTPERPGMEKCLRLVPNTQVVIISNQRFTNRKKDSNNIHSSLSGPFQIHPSQEDFTDEMKTLFEHCQGYLPEAPSLLTVNMHPKTLIECIEGWKEGSVKIIMMWKSSRTLCSSHDFSKTDNHNGACSYYSYCKDCDSSRLKEKGQYAVASLCSSEKVPRNSIVLNTYLRHQLEATPLEDSLWFEVIPQNILLKSVAASRSALENSSMLVQVFPVEISLQESFLDLPSRYKTNQSWNFPSEYVSIHAFQDNQKRLVKVSEKYADTLSKGKIFTLLINALECLSHLVLKDGSIIPVSDDGIAKYCFSIKIPNTCHSPESKVDLRESKKENESSLFLMLGRDLRKYLLESLKIKQSFHQFRLNTSKMKNPKILMKDLFLNMLPSSYEFIGKQPSSFSFIENHILAQALPIRSDYYSCRKHTEFNKCILISGPQGSGKTHLILSVAALLRVKYAFATIYLDCAKLQSSSHLQSKDIIKELTNILLNANTSQPSTVMLDNIHDLIPAVYENNNDDSYSVPYNQLDAKLVNQSKLLADSLSYLMHETTSRIVILCTCPSIRSINKSLFRKFNFSSIVNVPSLDPLERSCVFKTLLCKQGFLPKKYYVNIVSQACEQHVPNFEGRTEGYRPRDLVILVRKVQFLMKKFMYSQQQNREESQDISRLGKLIETALSAYTPLFRQCLEKNEIKTSLSMSSIGGLFKAKSILTDVLLRPMKYKSIYDKSPINLPRGILIYGFPGCGKTCIVNALANELGFGLIKCRGPEILDRYIGASEEKIRQLFGKAVCASPCILFLDEFDALAPRRGTDHTGVTDRVVNQLLTFLDGVESATLCRNKVFVIAATSRPDKIDAALLRPGRLEKHIFVGYPESLEEWSDLISKLSIGKKFNNSVKTIINGGSFSQLLIDQNIPIQRFSAADLIGIFDSAHIMTVRNSLETSKIETISIETLKEAFSKARPSLSLNEHSKLHNLYISFMGLNDQKLKSTQLHNDPFQISIKHHEKKSNLKTSLR